MCKICQQWENNEITSKKAFKLIGEAMDTKDKAKILHLTILSNKIVDAEVPFKDSDPELDKKWHEEQE